MIDVRAYIGYKATKISTIVDKIDPELLLKGYKATKISTIVDTNTRLEASPAIKPQKFLLL